MTISYDFIAFSGRLSEDKWTLGMKAIQGEVPLDIVLPNMELTGEDDSEIIGVLTKEGISRESNDVMELYRYLRQLNPKTNQTFGYNEVAIRNIHTHLSTLQVDQELRVQITYTERREGYIPASYNIKLLGISPIQAITPSYPEPPEQEPDVSEETDPTPLEDDMEDNTTKEEKPIIPKDFTSVNADIPVYKTTNTLEKLIAFTRTLQSELKKTSDNLAIMTEKVELLQDEQQRYREQDKLLQDIFDQLNILENFDRRINFLENDRHKLEKLHQTLESYLRTSYRQTRSLLQQVSDDPNILEDEEQPE